MSSPFRNSNGRSASVPSALDAAGLDHDHLFDPFQQILDERDSLSAATALLQRFMTAFPGLDDMPRETDPLGLLLRDVAILAGTAAGAAALATAAEAVGSLALLVPATYLALAAAGRLRKLTVGHVHEASHGVGFDEWADRRGMDRRRRRAWRFWLAETCSVIALTQSAIVYMKKHAKHHALEWLGTIFEPDGADLADEGFIRAMEKGAFFPRLASRLFNPVWYLRANLRRVTMTLTQGKPVRRGAAAGMWAAIIGSAFILPFPGWLFGVGLPWLVLYPAASMLQVVTEHPYGDRDGAGDLDQYAARTWDRLPWDPIPTDVQGGRAIAAWSRWLIRFAFLHLPARLAVLDTTMIYHRWHHLAWLLGRPFDKWWTIAFEARDAWRDGILPAGWQSNTLNGLAAALRRQRDHLES